MKEAFCDSESLGHSNTWSRVTIIRIPALACLVLTDVGVMPFLTSCFYLIFSKDAFVGPNHQLYIRYRSVPYHDIDAQMGFPSHHHGKETQSH